VICGRCKQDKPSGEFHKDPSKSSGLTWACKGCRSARERARSARRYARQPLAYNIVRQARARAAEGGFACTITESDIVIPTTCPLLGIELRRGANVSRDYAPSIDRIDPTLGYEPGNIWIISYRANRIKSDASFRELEAIVNGLRARLDVKQPAPGR
jgi:hypothetical protein